MKNLKVTISAMSLATSLLLAGCSEEKPNIPITAVTASETLENAYEDEPSILVGDSVTYNGKVYTAAHNPESEYIETEYNGFCYDDGIDTDCLFFVRVDNKTYLATKLTDKNENDVISKYYEINTGKFLGQTLEVNWYARAISQITNIMHKNSKLKEYSSLVNESLFDQDYFNGEYGLGKNLFSGAIINASSIFSEKRLSKQQIELLLNDELLLSCYVDKFIYQNMIPIAKENYTFIPLRSTCDFVEFVTFGYYIGFYGEISYSYNQLQRLTIENNEGQKNIIGYRASITNTDKGYYYFYDILSGKFVDISNYMIIDVEDIQSNETIDNIRKQSPLIQTYSLDDLNVISTLNLEGDCTLDNYYIVIRGDHFIGSTYKFNVVEENSEVSISGNYDGTSLCVSKKDGSYKSTSLGSYNGMMNSLEICLKENDMYGYIKDTYTNEELMILINKLRDHELKFENISSYQQTNKIALKDIVVVNTSKENSDSVLINEGKQYYILLPYNMDVDMKDTNFDKSYYETSDHSALAAISIEHGYIKIDNLMKTFYAVLKNDGELECISSLESALHEIGLDNYISDEYSLVDLKLLEEKMNQKEKDLVLNR